MSSVLENEDIMKNWRLNSEELCQGYSCKHYSHSLLKEDKRIGVLGVGAPKQKVGALRR